MKKSIQNLFEIKPQESDPNGTKLESPQKFNKHCGYSLTFSLIL